MRGEERQQLIAELYPTVRVTEIAVRAKVSPATIYNDLRELGIDRRLSVIDEAEHQHRVAIARQLRTVRAVVDAIGCNKRYARLYLKEAGITLSVGRPRVHPRASERACAYCREPFTPFDANAAHGFGIYCSRECAARGRIGTGPKKVTIICAQCGNEKRVSKWEADHGRRFCTPSCWGQYRGKYGEGGLLDLVLGAPHVSGTAKKSYAGKVTLAKNRDNPEKTKGAPFAKEVGEAAVKLVSQNPALLKLTLTKRRSALLDALMRAFKRTEALYSDPESKIRRSRSDSVYRAERAIFDRALERYMTDFPGETLRLFGKPKRAETARIGF